MSVISIAVHKNKFIKFWDKTGQNGMFCKKVFIFKFDVIWPDLDISSDQIQKMNATIDFCVPNDS